MMYEASLQPIIDRLEDLFSLFNEHYYNSELEMPVITISPDIRGCYGWCTAGKVWRNQENGYYEINFCAEYLSRSFEDICGTMLHEMVHLYNVQHDIKDCSRGGTYHNRKYKFEAEKRGLTVQHDEKYGWAATDLSDEARDYIARLGVQSFELHRVRIPKTVRAPRTPSQKYVCPVCGAKVRASTDVNVACMNCRVMMQKAA